jgi:hypothetical protein
MITPIKRFDMKKFPIITIAIKKRIGITERLPYKLGVISCPLDFEA